MTDRSQTTQDIFSNLLRIKHLTNSAYRIHKEPGCDLTHAQAELMWQVTNQPGTSIGQLAEWLGISSSAVAQLVTPLEKQGFVERAVDPDDRRITLLRATGKGRAQMEGIRSQAVHGLAGFLNHLSDQELDALLRLELKIINGTEKILNKEEDSEHGHV